MAKGLALIIYSLQIQQVLEEAVHLGVERGPGVESGLVLVCAGDSVGPYRGIAMQTGDTEVDLVGIITMREGDRLISELELTSAEERGVLCHFSIELQRRLNLEVFEYGSGDDQCRGIVWTPRMRLTISFCHYTLW